MPELTYDTAVLLAAIAGLWLVDRIIRIAIFYELIRMAL